jgi:hypothetical protein
MAKRTSNRSSAEDSGVATPAQPKPRRARASSSTPPSPEPDMIAAAPGVEGTEHIRDAQSQSDAHSRSGAQPQTPSNASGVASEAGDDAPLEAMGRESSSRSDASSSQSMGSEPSDEDIRVRAYHRYLERGGGHGQDFEDWLEAERELKAH